MSVKRKRKENDMTRIRTLGNTHSYRHSVINDSSSGGSSSSSNLDTQVKLYHNTYACIRQSPKIMNLHAEVLSPQCRPGQGGLKTSLAWTIKARRPALAHVAGLPSARHRCIPRER